MGIGIIGFGARRDALARVLGLALAMLCASESFAFSEAEVYRNAASSVVLIFGFDEGGGGSSGTGSILTRDGLVLTNDHVISNASRGAAGGRPYENLVVYFKPSPITGDDRRDLREPYHVDVVARDAALDLALLRVKNPPADIRPIVLGDSEEVDVGERVAAIGHPSGGGLWTLTTGTVSSKRRHASRDLFQTDAAISPGHSGGPLLDSNARLVGVNTVVRHATAPRSPRQGHDSLRSRVALAWVNRQGVTRVAAVSRASDARPSSAPRRPRDASPPRGLAPGVAPMPLAPTARTGGVPRPALPPPDPQARSFVTRDGTRMYGVPNTANDLDASLQHVRRAWADSTRRRGESTDEPQRRFDEYDNF